MGRIGTVARQSIAIARLLGLQSASKIYLTKALLAGQGQAAMHVPIAGISPQFWIRPKGSDLDVVLQIFRSRDYDLGWCLPYKQYVQAVCERVREQGQVPLIIDAGANIGASTLWFARAYPECQVFAVEPDRGNFDMLRRNVQGLANVTLFQAGLWDRTTGLAMMHEDATGWACRVEESAGGKAPVPGISVPDLLAARKDLRPVIVKIDIEGAEAQLLRSGTEWVDDIPLLIFESHDNLWDWLGPWQGGGHAFFSALSRRKREYLSRGENVFAFLHPGSADDPA